MAAPSAGAGPLKVTVVRGEPPPISVSGTSCSPTRRIESSSTRSVTVASPAEALICVTIS